MIFNAGQDIQTFPFYVFAVFLYFTICIIVVIEGNQFSGIESYAICKLLFMYLL